MYNTLKDDDQFINRYQWNALLLRERTYYSINHYRAQMCPTEQPIRMEIRYPLDQRRDFIQLQIDIDDLPTTVQFDDDDRVIQAT